MRDQQRRGRRGSEEDVLAGVDASLLRKPRSGAAARPDNHASEDAVAADDPDFAPHLILAR
jgi:hypothetical protein